VKTEQKMSKYILIGYYFLFSILLIYYSIKNPVPNWDMIAYVACAKSFVISDKQELHKYVYSELKNSVPKETYKFLTKGGPGFRELTEKDAEYRETLEKDSDAFAEALIFFKVRLIYNWFCLFHVKYGCEYISCNTPGVSSFYNIGVMVHFYRF